MEADSRFSILNALFLSLDVRPYSLLDVIHYTFENLASKHIFNILIRKLVIDNDIKSFLSNLDKDLLNSDILQLDNRTFPEIFARVQKVGKLNNQLQQCLKMKFDFVLAFADILHIDIQGFETVPLGSTFLANYISNMAEKLAIALDVACIFEKFI